MSRTNWILAAVLLLQLALAGWMLRPAAQREAAQPLLRDVAAEAVTRVHISDATGSVTLAKEGGGWSDPDADGFAVQSADVTRLISDVLSVDTARLVANTAASHTRLKVAASDFVHRIELDHDGKTSVLYVGSSPNANATHVRLDGQDAVYLAPGALASAARSDLGGWIDTRYVDIDPAAVSRIELFNGNGRFTLVKGADGAWGLADQASDEHVDQAVAASLASGLATLQMVRPLGKTVQPAYGLDSPQATATLVLSGTADGGQTLTLDVGAFDEAAGTYTVKSSASDFYALAGKFALQDLLEKSRAGLLVTGAADSKAAP